MFCEKTESDRKSLWRKIRARQNGAGAGSPCPARSFKRISYKKRLLINLGLIVALPPMTARSQATATKFLAFLLRFTKKIWFWLQHAKVPGILHAMNGICWNPHARKSAQGRSARGPNIPKSYRNFRQPPYDPCMVYSTYIWLTGMVNPSCSMYIDYLPTWKVKNGHMNKGKCRYLNPPRFQEFWAP